eukprot:COSAG04_NODE_37_length_33905_cov_5.439951_9_plen_298_part_00
MLSPAQIAFFKASGYLRVPAAQAQLDAELMERARADLWDGEPALVESDPSSWLGTVDELVDEGRGLTPEALSAAGHAGSRWIVRKSAKEDWMLQIVARNERIRGMISQLLGPWEGISEPGTRGLYCTRPCYRKSGERIPPELIEPRVDSDNKGPADTDGTSPCTSILGGEGIHSDGLGMDRVGAVAYIGDCPAGAGGFTVCARPCMPSAFAQSFCSERVAVPLQGRGRTRGSPRVSAPATYPRRAASSRPAPRVAARTRRYRTRCRRRTSRGARSWPSTRTASRWRANQEMWCCGTA